MDKPREAAKAKLWVCEEGHLHISLLDEDGLEFAICAIEPEETVDLVFELGDQIIKLYEDDEDTIGPTVGTA